MAEKIVEINQLYKEFVIESEHKKILNDINLVVNKGEFVAIVGASGCGKSTLLRIIAGLESVSSGEVLLNGEKVEKPSENVKVAFQEARLLPWWSVEKNIGFGLSGKEDKESRQEKIRHYIDLIGLNGFEKAIPKQLSGGMQQRVSIARALIDNPDIMLLDEPFGALDALTKITLQREILNIWEREKKTMILVTHDIDEAVYLSDRVIVMSDRPGEIKKDIHIQLSRPRDRGSSDFAHYKNLILSEFFDSEDKTLEDFSI